MIKSMPCITLWQPWASLVAGGFKEYETRNWKAPANLLGNLIAIHAAKKYDESEKFYTRRFIATYPEVKDWLQPEGYQNPPIQAIVCVCRLVGCYPSESMRPGVSRREQAFGDWSDGRYVWKLEVVKVPPTPIAIAGKQRVWAWQYELPEQAS